MDIAGELPEIAKTVAARIGIDRNGFIMALIHIPSSLKHRIETLRVGGLKPRYPYNLISFRRFETKMEMIGHLAVRVNLPACLLTNFFRA